MSSTSNSNSASNDNTQKDTNRKPPKKAKRLTLDDLRAGHVSPETNPPQVTSPPTSNRHISQRIPGAVQIGAVTTYGDVMSGKGSWKAQHTMVSQRDRKNSIPSHATHPPPTPRQPADIPPPARRAPPSKNCTTASKKKWRKPFPPNRGKRTMALQRWLSDFLTTAIRRVLVLDVERKMGMTGERCGSVRGARGGSTVGGRARSWIGVGIGWIVWRERRLGRR